MARIQCFCCCGYGWQLQLQFEPHVWSPHLGIWHWEKEPLEHLALKARGACVQELHRTGGNGDPFLERCTQAFMYTGIPSYPPGAWMPPYAATSNLIQRQSPTYQRSRNQPHLPVGTPSHQEDYSRPRTNFSHKGGIHQK